MKKYDGWWDGFFPAFRPIFSKVPARVTNAQVRFIREKLDLRAGRTFLDCPCGIGRIALPLARTGVRVTGIDITQSYLDELAGKVKKSGLKMDLHRQDMRRISLDSKFDACGNLWTSFGYFEKESDNLLVLKKMFRALKPGGKFMLHVINRDWIMANFQANEWYQSGDMKVLENRGFDYAKSISTDVWTFIGPEGSSTHETAIRMYSYHELISMFERVGFIDIEGYGSVKGEPISRNKEQMFVIGTRPRR
ncbi:MAG: methyltransferase domain-containing protein [Candidatus Zixiibacteriota bacterium]|nr:MAG: methyltransferase domain-containing protein [candidate division Zixibacteria bacterium]